MHLKYPLGHRNIPALGPIFWTLLGLPERKKIFLLSCQPRVTAPSCFFLVLSLFYRSQMVNFKEIYHFSRFQRGPTFSRGGHKCLFPKETHITCHFPGGGVLSPCPPPPLLIRTCLPAKSDSHIMFCLQSYRGLGIDRSLVY